MINFDPVTHTYTNIDGVVYDSVSQLITKYKKPFDVEFYSRRVAKKRGISPDVVKEEWKKNTENACDFGKSIHSLVEEFIKGNDKQDPIIDKFQSVFDYSSGINSEIILYNHTHKLAGTSDIIVDIGDKFFDVLDVKTNKKFDFNNKYGDFLLQPLDHLQDCKYNSYSIQLSLYAYMYSKMTGRKPRNLYILYWNKTSFEKYVTPYMFWEVTVLLKHRSEHNVINN